MVARLCSTVARISIVLATVPSTALAQDPRIPPPVQHVRLSGPRVGVTYLGGSIVDSLAAYDVDVAPFITQFGWQFERMIYTGDNGLAAVTEWVVLVGGLEQNAFIPSVSWLVGLRGRNGTEFGVGPNISPAGSSLAIAGGVTTRAGAFNLPVNIAVVPGKIGTRVSILLGFTTRSASYRSDAPPLITRPRAQPRSRPEWPPFGAPRSPTSGCCRASP